MYFGSTLEVRKETHNDAYVRKHGMSAWRGIKWYEYFKRDSVTLSLLKNICLVESS